MKKMSSTAVLAMILSALPMHASEECSVVPADLSNPLLQVLSGPGDTGCSEVCSLVDRIKSADRERFVNEVDGEGNAPLYYASKMGVPVVVSALLEASADPHFDYNERVKGVTALFCAAEAGRDEVVRILLQAGARQDTVTEQNDISPLLIASRKGHANVVTTLLHDSKAMVGRATKYGTTPLGVASARGHVGVVKAFIEAGADLSGKVPPLLLAARRGHEDVVEELIAAKVDLNAVSNGVSSVSYAAAGGHASVVEKLANAGADLTEVHALVAEDGDGFGGALWEAINNGHVGIAGALYQKGAPVVVPANWEHILHNKRYSQKYIDQVRQFCEQSTPLHKAVKDGDMEKAKQWVYKVDFGAKDAEGRSCFDIPGDEKVKAFLQRSYDLPVQQTRQEKEVRGLEDAIRVFENGAANGGLISPDKFSEE